MDEVFIGYREYSDGPEEFKEAIDEGHFHANEQGEAQPHRQVIAET